MIMQRDLPESKEEARGRLAVIISLGAVMQGLLLGLIVLYVNIPAGYNSRLGLTLDAIPLFSAFWHYPRITLAAEDFAFAARLLMIAVWVVYLVAYWLVRRWQNTVGLRTTIRVIGVYALLFNLTLMVVLPPLFSSDIYYYGLNGRLMALYGLNPYITTAASIPGDPIVPYVAWKGMTALYGPTWTLLASGAAALGGQSVIWTIMSLKGVAVVANLANCVLVLLLSRKLNSGTGIGAMLLYAWNPLVLVEVAGSGHNDVVMVTFALLGVLLITKGRLLKGVAVLVASVLVKYVMGLLAVFVIVSYLTRTTSRREAAKALVGTAVVGGITAAILYLPFTFGSDWLRGIISGWSPSQNVMPNNLIVMLRASWVRIMSNFGPLPLSLSAEAALTILLNLVFVLCVVALLWHIAKTKAAWPRTLALCGWTMLAYVIFIYGGGFPWYMISITAVAVVGPETRLNRDLLVVCILLSIIMMMNYASLIAI